MDLSATLSGAGQFNGLHVSRPS